MDTSRFGCRDINVVISDREIRYASQIRSSCIEELIINSVAEHRQHSRTSSDAFEQHAPRWWILVRPHFYLNMFLQTLKSRLRDLPGYKYLAHHF
jgi:hypothetical protein